jgi:hypothetical protein
MKIYPKKFILNHVTLIFTFACFALSPQARAVVPAPDGGYPNGNTAEGTDALFSLTTDAENTAMGFDVLYSKTTGSDNAPASWIWRGGGRLNTPRINHTATLLADGRVLVAGGYNSADLASAELYDPASRTWTATGSLNVVRLWHTATLLQNGMVLVAGGETTGGATTSAELYDPASGSVCRTRASGV